MPTGIAAARHEFAISSAGVVMKASSCANSHGGPITSTRNASGAAIATHVEERAHAGDAMPTNAVMRMCSPRRSAITAPSIASHRNRIDASSSDQTSGVCRT